MVINGLNLPSIGLIRAKPHPCGERYTLAIFPPGRGSLDGIEPATLIELEVDTAEVERIVEVAPHLLARSRNG